MSAAGCAPPAISDAESFDLAVIGAGSAGFAAAIAAAEMGARVALIGHGTIGGTCVNTGCVPSKTLVRASEALHRANMAERFAGIRSRAQLADWRAAIAQKDALVAAMRRAKYADLLPGYPAIRYREGRARLSEAGVAVNGSEVKAGKIVIASGAAAAIPSIPGLASIPYLTSATALDLDRRPQSLLVIGGGYVGCELGQMFARAGVRVTIACRSRLLPRAEPEIGAALARYFEAEGITVRDGLRYKSIQRGAKGVALAALRHGTAEILEVEQVLVATGRRPNSAGLGLKEAGVEMRASGAVVVDERMRTTKPGVYAAGDVTGRDEFVYMAAYGARIAAENALNGDLRRYDATAMPQVVFTDPQMARVGLTEAEARAQNLSLKTSVLPLDRLPRALAARDTRGLIKLVAAAEDGRLLGAHILAPEGGDSIQSAALAIKAGLTVEALAETIFPYLTTVEGLKLAAQGFAKDVARLSCCAG